MNKETDNNQAINQYLLGLLPEAEAERLDEQSFTDDDFADALSVAEKDLVDAYVQGELTGKTLEQFRAHYLSSATRRQRVEFAQAFQDFAKNSAVAPTPEIMAETRSKAATQRKSWSWFPVTGVLPSRLSALQWVSVAAVLVLLFSGGWLVVENVRLRQQLSTTQPSRDALVQREEELRKELERQRAMRAQTEQELARVREERERLDQESNQPESQRPRTVDKPASSARVASFVLVPQLRAVGQVPVVSIPAATDEVEMQLRLEPNEFSAYRVSLLTQAGNQTLWRSGTLKARATGQERTLSVRLRADLLKPQVFDVQVSGVSANGASEVVGDYPFKVVRP
ncbi:MAG: hypothetical protein ACRD6N_20510 [Pyrinomonadaceae bacterium]